MDLGSRIGLAADLQARAGNAATAAMLGEVRTDREVAPPNGVREIMATGVGGRRGLTRATHRSQAMPLFRLERPSRTGDTYRSRARPPRLESLDQEVWWPAPGRHLVRPLGQGNQLLDVTQDWSARILEGENEHVSDNELAYDRTWGTVVRVLTAMADGAGYSGDSEEAVLRRGWADFRRRLPAPLRPDGDLPTRDAQESRWGIENPGSAYVRLMQATKAARDDSGFHTPAQTLKEHRGRDRIDELSDGQSRIPGPESQQVIDDAWDRLTG
jgi:hypothetical protein